MSFLMMLLTSFNVQAANPCTQANRVFYFNMPIFIGNKIFNDQVEICKTKQGLQGQLEVPKRFTVKLENIKYEGNQLSFSITADEGRGKFKVFYAGELKNNKKFFMGIARLEKNKILGPFVGLASQAKTKMDIVQ